MKPALPKRPTAEQKEKIMANIKPPALPKRPTAEQKAKIISDIEPSSELEKLKLENLKLKSQLTEKKQRATKPKKSKVFPPQKTGNCLVRGNKELQPHQKEFIENFINSPLKGAIAIHGVGTGKTLTAVATSQCFLDANPESKVIVLTPASLVEGFKKELYEYDPALEGDKRYIHKTFDAYSRNPIDCSNALLIIDEGQNLRTFMNASETTTLDEETGEYKTVVTVTKGKRVHMILEYCAKKAKKILVLTATPMVNEPYDIENLMAMINGVSPLTPEQFYIITGKQEYIERYFGCRLSFFNSDPASRTLNFPSETIVDVPLVMTPKMVKQYEEVSTDSVSSKKVQELFNMGDETSSNFKSFYNGVRRASNILVDDSGLPPKVKFIIDFITNRISEQFKKQFKKITGDILIEKNENKKYNDQYIVFSNFLDAGSKIVEEQLRKNNISYASINGSVTKKKRAEIVNKYVKGDIKVVIISKAGAEGLNLLKTGYIFIMDQGWNNTLMEQVIGRGVRYKSHMDLPPEKRNVKIFKLFLITPKEASSFNKTIASASPFLNGTIDLMLNGRNEHKQESINKFIDKLKKINPLEACKYDLEYIKLRNYISKSSERMNDEGGLLRAQKNKLDFPNMTNAEANLMKEYKDTDINESLYEPKFNKYKTKDRPEEDKDRLKRVLPQIEALKEKLYVKTTNSFFTPPILAQLIISDVVQLSRINDKIKILEPTAGAGHIVLSLTEYKNVYVDVCEYTPELRDLLSTYERVNVLPYNDSFSIPQSYKYHLIVMNPPFSINKGGKRFYDVDFVRDMYDNHLLNNGMLVCIIGSSWLFNTKKPFPQFREWINTKQHEYVEYNEGFLDEQLKVMKTKVKMTIIRIFKTDGPLEEDEPMLI
jgi:superfamily II DNA/RNA helicase